MLPEPNVCIEFRIQSSPEFASPSTKGKAFGLVRDPCWMDCQCRRKDDDDDTFGSFVSDDVGVLSSITHCIETDGQWLSSHVFSLLCINLVL